jgi:hypothetical protein
MQRRFVRRFTTALNLAHCQRECIEARDFICRAFNYRSVNNISDIFNYRIMNLFVTLFSIYREGAYGESRDNCELSDRATRELDAANPSHFDNTANEYDFYERALGRIADDCLDGNRTMINERL